MANKEKGLFKVTIDNGKEVTAQQMKINGERYYTVFGSAYAYNSKQEIKECKSLNQTK